MKPQLGAAALAAVAALAIPAVAGAHPSVYTASANVVKANSDPVELETQTRYLVNNHGFPILFRESNGLNSGSAGDRDASWQKTIASAPRRTPSNALPPPLPSAAPSIRPGISTSCTRTPPIRVSAGTGRVVVNA